MYIKPIYFRPTQTQDVAIRTQAESELRTISNHLRLLVELGLKAYEAQQKPQPAPKAQKVSK